MTRLNGSIEEAYGAGNVNVGGLYPVCGVVRTLTINGIKVYELLEILIRAARMQVPSPPIAPLHIRLHLNSNLTKSDVISTLIHVATTLVQLPRVSFALILTGNMAEEDLHLLRRLRKDLLRHRVIAAHPKLQARINFDFQPAEKRLKDGHSYAAALRAGEDPWESGPVLNEAGAVAS